MSGFESEWSGFDEGGGAGPWLRFHPRNSEDGTIPAGSWSLKTSDGGREVIDAMSRGVPFDLFKLKTGYERSSGGLKGQAPDRVWGDSPSKRPQRPGPEWAPAQRVPVGVSRTQVAEWTQSGAGAWQGLCHLIRQVQAGIPANPGKVPVMRQVSLLRSDRGRGVTLIPQWELVVAKEASTAAAVPLRWWVTKVPYLANFATRTHRVALDGAPAGEISEARAGERRHMARRRPTASSD
jgi:hypothetical protein